MPYKTNAERDHEKWMTLPEAVSHICSADNCDEDSARHQLVAALADGLSVLGPLKWKREGSDKPPSFGSSPVTIPTDTPPLGRVWLKANIKWKTGTVRDNWGEYKNGKYRVLLIQRHSINRNWPPPSKLSIPSGATSTKAIDLSTHKSGGRPSERAKVFNALDMMRKEGIDMATPQKTLADEAAKRNNKKLGDRNWSERAIKEHVSKWLDKHR